MRVIDGISIGILAGSAHSINILQMLGMKYFQSHMGGVNEKFELGLSESDQSEVLRNANAHSPLMGHNPLDLLLSGAGGSKDEILADLRTQAENTLRSDFAAAYPGPITDVLMQYSQDVEDHSRISASEISPAEVVGQYLPEPMKTIMLLKTHSHPDVKARGNNLLKKAYNRCLLFPDKAQRDQCRSRFELSQISNSSDNSKIGDFKRDLLIAAFISGE